MDDLWIDSIRGLKRIERERQVDDQWIDLIRESKRKRERGKWTIDGSIRFEDRRERERERQVDDRWIDLIRESKRKRERESGRSMDRFDSRIEEREGGRGK